MANFLRKIDMVPIADRLGSLRFKVMGAAVAVVVAGCAAVFALWDFQQRRQLEAAYASTQLPAARQLAHNLEDKVKVRLRALESFARGLDLDRLGDTAGLERYLAERQLLSTLFSGGALIVDPEGKVLADHPAAPGRRDANVGDRRYVREAVATGKPVVGEPIMGRGVKRAVLNMSAPAVDREGRVRALVVGVTVLSDNRFLGLSDDTGHLGPAQVLLVSLRDWVFIDHSDRDRVMTALPPPGASEIADRVRAGFEGAATLRASDGTEKIYSVVRMPSLQWALVIGTPTAVAYAPIRQWERQAAWSALAATLLAALAMYLVTRRLTANLSDATSRLEAMSGEAGTLARLPQAGDRETTRLFESFNRLAGRIQSQDVQLRESQERLRLFIEHAPAALAMFDTGMRYLAASRRWYADYGLGERDVLGRSHYEIFPEISEAWKAVHRRALAGEVVRADEDRFERADGSVQWLRWEVRPWHRGDGDSGSAGEIGGVVIFTEDITQIKAAEARLAASEERFRLAQDAAHVGVWEWNLESGKLYWSAQTRRLYGMEPGGSEPPDQDFWRRHVHPDDLPLIDAQWSRIAAGQGFEAEYRYRPDSGETRWLLTKGDAEHDAAGKPVRLMGINMDISERKRLQQQMDEHRADLERKVAERTHDLVLAHRQIDEIQAAMDEAGIGIRWVDARSGRFVYVNRRAAQMLGYTVDEMLALTVSDIDPNDPLQRFAEAGRELSRPGTIRFESTNTAKDGRVIPVDMLLNYREASPDAPARFIAFVTDITARKEAQAALQQAKAAAEAASIAKGEFLANMSHEIRTPLNGVLGLAQLGWRDSVGRKKAQDTFSRILDSGHLLLTILNDILDFSKIEAGKLSVENLPLDPTQIADDALHHAQLLAAGKAIELRVEKTDLPRACLGDPVRIAQVLLNLLSNAVKFTQAGEVRLAARRAGDTLEFEVSDTGPGIAPQVLQRLFRPFEQADGSITRQHGGTGLGLAISRRLALLMGGTLEAASEPGRGSRFTLRLPLRQTRQPVLPMPVRGVPGQERLAGRRLLVAEDNPVNQLVLEDLLHAEGAQTVVVSSGRQAVEAIERADAPFDAVLMDVQMPEMDGLQATRVIKQRWPTLPVVGQTARALDEDRRNCLAAGMSAVVTKPIEVDVLVSTLSQQFAAASTAAPAVAAGAAPAQAWPGADAVLDWEALSRRYAGKPELAARLVGLALQSHAGDAERLRASAAAGDFAGIERVAHDLKSLAGNLFAAEAQRLAVAAMEGARQHSPAATNQALALADAVDRLFGALEAGPRA